MSSALSSSPSLNEQANSSLDDTTATAINVDPSEVDKFNKLASEWWSKTGAFATLHEINPLRLNWIEENVKRSYQNDSADTDIHKTAETGLTGKKVLDVGCGGGLLSEALAQAGAKVTAIDLAPNLLKVARLHGLESGIKVDYRELPVEALAEEMLAEGRPASFDAITCMEMLEHVPEPGSVIRACATLLKPGGRLFLSTLNRTPAAFALAIVGAEYVARLLPKGTHQYRDFIKPSELAKWLREAGLELEDVSGLMYEPWRNSARVIARTDINYLAYARKPG